MIKPFEPKVLQLVTVRQSDKQLHLTQQGKKFLQQIHAPISVITIAGLYRTGKSYLVNQLLSKLHSSPHLPTNKFPVGDTIQSCTKGLNVWAVPFQATSVEPHFYYILVDSEGIGSLEQEQNYDINLLTLIFLISSTVIYNSVGAIDQQSLDQLRVIVNLKKSLGQQPNTQPRFIWVLRDFVLQLINKNGEEMTSNQYLEDCLQLVSSTNKQVIKKNEIREAIRQHLPNRQCHTLVRPTIIQQELSNLNSLPKNKLRKQFIDQVNQLYSSIFTNSIKDIKFINEKKNLIDGPGLVKMISYCLSEINSSKTPVIKTVWELIQSTQLEQLIEECQNQLKTQTLKIDLPIPEQQLKQRLNQIQNKIFTQFQNQLPSSDLKIYKKFSQNFLKLTHKINTKIRKANQQIKKKKQFKKVRETINSQIQFDQINPCQIGYLRQVIQKLDLKSFPDSEIFYYVINSVLDVMDIAQEKTVKIKEELQLCQEAKNQTDIDKNTKDQELTKLKHHYHEALKEISYLKNSQIDNVKDLAITKQQLSLMESKFSLLTTQKLSKQDQLKRKIDELNEKIRKKHEQSVQAMKSLRAQNQSLTTELQQAKSQINHRRNQTHKEMNFEDKIKQSWDRFEQERTYFKKELQNFKHLYFQSEQKARNLQEKQRNLENTLNKDRQSFVRKQKEFCEQLKWMKENYSKTKDAYNQSYNTRIENEQILKDITVGSRKKNTNQNQNTFPLSLSDNTRLDQLTSTCQTLTTQKIALQKQISMLQSRAKGHQKQIEEARDFYQKKINKLEQKISIMENSTESQKQRFYTCLKELQESKESERQMYEDSIMRLFNNMEICQPIKFKSRNLQKNSQNSNNKTKKYFY